MATFCVVIHEYRCRSVFQYLCSRLFTGIFKSLFSVVNNKFLSKGIDKVFRSSGDDELIRVDRCEAYRVAYHIAPQSARRAYHHSVVLSRLNTPQRDARCRVVKAVHRDELVEHVVVEHQQHSLVGRVVLQSEETFAGIICLHIVHVGTCYKSFVLTAIRSECHSSVEEYLDVRPHLLKMLFAAEFHNAGEYRQHPRRYTAEVSDVLVEGLACYTFTFLFEVGEKCCLLSRHAYEVHQRVDILYEYGTEVTHQGARNVIVGSMTAAEDKSFAVEHPALGVVLQIHSHSVGAASIVYALQSFLGNRDELTLVVGRSRRFGVPFYLSPPENVFLSVAHTVYVRFQFLVCVYGDVLGEILISTYVCKVMVVTIFRFFCTIHQPLQDLFLQFFSS